MPTSEAELALRRAIERLISAERAKDVEALGALLAADYRGFDAVGVAVDRRALLDRFADPDFHLTEHVISEVEVRILGVAAVVQGRARLVGSFRGRAFAGEFRFIDVWVERTGWQVVASQLTPIASPV